MKDQYVDETLTQCERVAPFAQLAEPDCEPLPDKRRTALVWDGPNWAEIDPQTGEILSTGSVG